VEAKRRTVFGRALHGRRALRWASAAAFDVSAPAPAARQRNRVEVTIATRTSAVAAAETARPPPADCGTCRSALTSAARWRAFRRYCSALRVCGSSAPQTFGSARGARR
jgi:hypothetical protein